MISTILLRPHADTRERLLAPHAPVWIPAEPEIDEPAEFGTTVDRATPGIDDDENGDDELGERIKVSWPSLGVCDSVASALYLVLARDGAVVPEGVDRLARIRSFDRDETETAFRAALAGTPGSINALRRWFGVLGTLLLLLDSSGSEVSP